MKILEFTVVTIMMIRKKKDDKDVKAINNS